MEKNINYTDMAVQKLDNAIAKLRKDIEKDIVKSKNYPGEDVIEITASDIEDAFDRIVITSSNHKYHKIRRVYKVLALLYMILGCTLIAYVIDPDVIIRGFIQLHERIVMNPLLGVVIIATAATVGVFFLEMVKLDRSEQAFRQTKDELQTRILREELHNYISYIEWKMREQSENQSLEVNCEANEKKTPSNPDSEPKIEGI